MKSFSHALVSLRNVQALLHFQRYGQGGEGGSELNGGDSGLMMFTLRRHESSKAESVISVFTTQLI